MTTPRIHAVSLAQRVFLLALVIMAFIAHPAVAAILYFDGFESGYTTGALYGQGNWRVANAAPSNNSALVENTFVHSGSQAMELVLDSSVSAANWAAHALTTPAETTSMTVSFWLGADATGRRSATMSLNTGTNPWDTTLLGVRSYADASTSWSEMFWYRNSDGSWTNTGVAMTGSTWWNLQVSIDLTSRTYNFYVQEQNGTLQTLATGIALPSSVTSLPAWMQITRNYGGANDEVYVDDINVSAVPEPSSTALLLIVGLSVVGARRFRKGGE